MDGVLSKSRLQSRSGRSITPAWKTTATLRKELLVSLMKAPLISRVKREDLANRLLKKIDTKKGLVYSGVTLTGKPGS